MHGSGGEQLSCTCSQYAHITAYGKFSMKYEPVHEKTNNLGSDQVRYKPGCTVTEDGMRMEISELRRRGIVLSV